MKVKNLDHMSRSYYLGRHLMFLQQVKDTKGSKEKRNSKCALKERYGKIKKRRVAKCIFLIFNMNEICQRQIFTSCT
jgi:hypothetical protein